MHERITYMVVMTPWFHHHVVLLMHYKIIHLASHGKGLLIQGTKLMEPISS